MSHVVSVQTEVRDPVAIRSVCSRLHLPEPVFGKTKLFNNSATGWAEYIRACFTCLWIESHEHQDALVAMAQLCRQEDWRLATWDIDQGLKIPGTDADTAASEVSPGVE